MRHEKSQIDFHLRAKAAWNTRSFTPSRSLSRRRKLKSPARRPDWICSSVFFSGIGENAASQRFARVQEQNRSFVRSPPRTREHLRACLCVCYINGCRNQKHPGTATPERERDYIYPLLSPRARAERAWMLRVAELLYLFAKTCTRTTYRTHSGRNWIFQIVIQRAQRPVCRSMEILYLQHAHVLSEQR